MPHTGTSVRSAIIAYIDICHQPLLILAERGRVPGTRELVIPKTPFIGPYRLQRDVIQVLRVYNGTRRSDDRIAPAAKRQMKRNQYYGHSPSVAEPRRPLIQGVFAFVREVYDCPGVLGIALLGSLTTNKAIPKDADVLVTIDAAAALFRLASASRRLQGFAQSMNLGADIFLADDRGRYIGRVCHYRECFPRAACRAQNCGRRDHVNDDFQVITLAKELITAPPVTLCPNVVRRVTIPSDLEELLLAKLERAG